MYRHLLAVTAILLAAGWGCRSRSREIVVCPGPPQPQPVLQQMLDTYKGFSSYRDEGVLRLSYERGGEVIREEVPFAVTFVRPNKIKLQAYQVTLAADGETLRARIADRDSHDLDGQILVRPVSAKLEVDDVYADPILHSTIQGGLGGYPIQIEMLLREKPLEPVFQGGQASELLSPGAIGERVCQRVKVPTSSGPFVFWIDQENHHLLRFEYPPQIAPDLTEQEGVANVRIAAEFPNIRVNEPVADSEFAFDIPADAKRVSRFVLPPQPLPSDLFGKRPAEFSFTNLDGEKLTSSSLADQIVVLLWFRDHPECRSSLQALQEVRQKYRDREEVAFFAVCTEPSSTGNGELTALLRDWRVDVPLVRDLDACGDSVFHVTDLPTLVVLDGQGVLHLFQVGANPQLATELPSVIERLLKGENIAAEVLGPLLREREEYVQHLIAAGGPELAERLPMQPVAEKSSPRQLKLEPLWTAGPDQIQSPGNVLVVPAGDDALVLPKGNATFVVQDGWRSFVEFDRQGKIVARRDLDLPPRGLVSYLRTATDKDGRRYFAGSAMLNRQAFVFDAQGKRLASYPPPEQNHAGIADVALADMDGDGKPELVVGFYQELGVHAATLSGERLWSSRELPDVRTVAITPPNDLGWHKVLAAGTPGFVLRLNQFGKHDPPVAVPKRRVEAIYSAGESNPAEPPRPTSYLGIVYTATGKRLAVGLNAELREQWTYELPAGAFRHPVQSVAAVSLLSSPGRQWLMASADGTIDLVSDDGEFNDTFCLGEPVTGLNAVRIGEQGLLIVSTPSGVTALEVK